MKTGQPFMYTEDTGFSKVEEAFGEQHVCPFFVNRGSEHFIFTAEVRS